MPFAVALGVEVTAASAAEVRGRLAWAPERCTTGGVLHGAAIMGLADTLGAICAFLNLPPGAGTATIESKTNFFAAVRSGSVEGVTQPLHVGRRTIVVQTDVRDPSGRRVALVTQTQAVLAE
jgi:uncharacterized protein (TIGR00369 family)